MSLWIPFLLIQASYLFIFWLRKCVCLYYCKYCIKLDLLISILYLACMVLHVVLLYHGMGFVKCDNVFIVAFPFLDSHSVMGFSCFG